jgi:hypothetical protein
MITITIPRNTSMETRRDACTGGADGLELTIAIAGELAVVTMPRCRRLS